MIPRSADPSNPGVEAVFMPSRGVSLSASQPKGEKVNGLKQAPVWAAWFDQCGILASRCAVPRCRLSIGPTKALCGWENRYSESMKL